MDFGAVEVELAWKCNVLRLLAACSRACVRGVLSSLSHQAITWWWAGGEGDSLMRSSDVHWAGWCASSLWARLRVAERLVIQWLLVLLLASAGLPYRTPTTAVVHQLCTLN
jgi:hypothetical protein